MTDFEAGALRKAGFDVVRGGLDLPEARGEELVVLNPRLISGVVRSAKKRGSTKPVVVNPPKKRPTPKRRASLAGDKGEVIQVEGGYIDIQYKDTKFSPRGQSVVDFVVEESKRGEGIGKTLLDKALKKHPDLGGQVSSRAALKVAHNAGMRNPSNPDATLEKLFKQLESDTSVFMAINDEAGRSSAAKSVAKGSARQGSSSNKKTGGEVKVKASKGRKAHTRRKPKQH